MPLKAVAGAVLLVLPVAAGAAGSVVVLRDGRALHLDGEARVEGALTFVEIGPGSYASIATEAIDWPATRRARELLGDGAPGRARRPPPRRHGPAEGEPASLASLPDEVVLLALLHTGRPGEWSPSPAAPRGPDEELAPPRRPGPPLGPPPPSGEHLAVAAARPVPSVYSGAAGATDRQLIVPRLATLVPPPSVSVPPSPPRRGGGGIGVVVLREPLLVPRPPAGDYLTAARFESPRADEVVAGKVALLARPSSCGAEVTAIEYRVDGGEAVRTALPPFSIEHTFPPGNGRHRLVARIERGDGTVETAAATVSSIVPDVEVDVDLVTLSVQVTNQQYFFVRTLEAGDFVVYEDGLPQAVAHFSRDAAPATVLVLIDTSWSMNGKRLEMCQEGVRRLADALGPEDRLGVAAFGDSYALVLPPTIDHDQAVTAVEELSADGTTAMFDAEIEALQRLASEPGRRVLVVLGDGEDYASKGRIEAVIDQAQRGGVSIYAVGLLTYRLKDGMPDHWTDSFVGRGRPKYWGDGLRVRGLKFLRKEAEETGGVLYLPRFTGEMPYVFEHLVAELKNTYTLGYYPKNHRRDGRFRAVEVFVDGDGLVARAKRGYYAPAEGVARR